MRGLNSVMMFANLGRDPEIRYTQGGTAVCNLRCAVSDREKRNDEWQDVTVWLDVVCFGKQAEFAASLKKGSRVFVWGRLREREWESKTGEKRSKIEVLADRVDALDRKVERPEATARAAVAGADDDNGDDLPF